MKLVPKVLIMLLTATVGSIGTYAVIEIKRQQNDLSRDAADSNSARLASILPGLSKSMWNMDKDLVKTTMASLFEHGEVSSVVSFDDNGKCFMGLISKKSESGTARETEESECEKSFQEMTGRKDNTSITPFNASPTSLIAPMESRGDYQQRLIASLWEADEASGSKKFIGHAIMDFSTSYVRDRIWKMQVRIMGFAALMGGVILALTFLFLRTSVLQHIQRLTRAAEQIAAGKFTRVEEKKSEDEVGVLTRHFNQMVGKLEGEVENLRLITEEGLAISSAITFISLTNQIEKSFRRVLGKPVAVRLFIAHDMFVRSTLEPGFYPVDGEDSPLSEAQRESTASTGAALALVIHNPMGKNDFGFIEVDLEHAIEQNTAHIFNALLVNVANALANIRFVEEQREQQKMLADMETTSFVQRSLIPQYSDLRFGNFEIASFFKPAATCGGDWWNYFPLPDGRLLLLLGDVTGHGISSAFITAVVKGYCDSIYRSEHYEISQIMRELNVVVSTCSHGHFLMTMFGLLVDPATKTISYSNAAHNAPFHHAITIAGDQGSARLTRLMQIGPRLGFDPKTSLQKDHQEHDTHGFRTRTIPYHDGDTLLVFSDGLIECENEDGVQFSDKRLKGVLEHGLKEAQGLGSLRDSIVRAFEGYCGKSGQGDDVTFFLLRLHEEEVKGSEFHPTMYHLFQS